MKLGAIVLFFIAFIGLIALIQLQSSAPSAFVVQPSDDRVLGYCPVSQVNQPCYLGGREGTCTCQTLDTNKPLYWQRDNCQCLVPYYIQGTWPEP